MSAISSSTNVYLWVYHPPHSGQRAWIACYETVRNKLGELVVRPELDNDPANAMSLRYDLAIVLKRRLESENVLSSLYQVRFSLNPTGEEVAGGNTTSAPTEDNRVVMAYRGILVRPGVSVNHGRAWFVKFPGQAIESIRAESPEEAVNICYERGLNERAEQAPTPPPAPPEQPAQTYPGYKIRRTDRI